jgi:hypothetical protein
VWSPQAEDNALAASNSSSRATTTAVTAVAATAAITTGAANSQIPISILKTALYCRQRSRIYF